VSLAGAIAGMLMDESLVDLAVEEPEWTQALPGLEDDIATGARLALDAAGLDPEGWAISVLACSDDRIAGLNRDFRGREGPTNVLSWPALELAPPRPGAAPGRPKRGGAGGRQALGDVAIALQTARREAAERSIPLKDHVIHLILHGCLHLLGYDPETEKDAERMEGMETRALARIGVSDPYSSEGAA